MSVDTMRAKVESVIKVGMTSNYPAVKVQYENVAFDQPRNAPYIAVWVLEGKNRQANLGDHFKTRAPGVLQIDVMVPEDTGTKTQNEICKYVGGLFKRQSFNLTDGAQLRFRVPTVNTLGCANGFNRKVVSIEYWRDDPFE